jgi:WD40 repeat protein
VTLDGGPNPAGTPVQGVQYGDGNRQQNYFAPVTRTLFSGGFERLRDVCFDPWALERDLDLPRFTGREWLIQRLDEFLDTRNRGYVIILAEAGVGKSSLAAHLVGTRPWLHHFTRLSGGRSPEAARKSLAAQIISRWHLEDWAPGGILPTSADRPDWFDRLLHTAAKKRDEEEPGERIVLVVDGLDEFEEENTGGIGLRIGLPVSLPDGVYVIATSRFGIERVLHAIRNPAEWHQIEVEGRDNLVDMGRFINTVSDPVRGDKRLIKALQKDSISLAHFRETLANRCAGVWIYLRYVLDEICDGERAPSQVEKLPSDLAGYYAEQIARWRGDPDSTAHQARWEKFYLPILGTLGVARGPLTIDELESFAHVREFGSARAFVEETARAFLNRHDHADPVRYGIRHQSFRDLLIGTIPDSRPDLTPIASMFTDQARLAHQRIALSLIPPGVPGERIWRSSSAYAMQHLASHAAACGLLDDLLNDPGFLVNARPESVLANRGNVRSVEASRSAAALRLGMDGWLGCGEAERLRRLAVNAARMRAFPLIEACAKLTRVTWPIRWAAMAGHIHQVLPGHHRPIRAVAMGRAADRDIVVSASEDRTIRIWDAATGARMGDPLTGHLGAVSAVATGQVAGHDIIVSGSEDSTIWVWDAVSGKRICGPLTGHAAGVNSVAIGRVAGRDVIISGSNDETAQVWDCVTGQPVGEPLTGHRGVVNAVALGQAAGRDVIVSGSEDGTMRVWDAATGDPLGGPLVGHKDWVNAVAIGCASDREIIVSGSEDGTIWVWDASTHEPIHDPLIQQSEPVAAVAIGQIADNDVIVSCSSPGNFKIWDTWTGKPIGNPPTDQAGKVTAVAIRHSAGTDMIVSGAQDGTLMTWDAAILDPLIGHDGPVAAIALGRLGGRDLLVSGSLEYQNSDGSQKDSDSQKVLRIWDAVTGDLVCAPEAARPASIWAVAIGHVAGRDVIVSGSGPLIGYDGDDANEDDRPVNLAEFAVDLWEPLTGSLIAELIGHHGPVYAVALGRAAGRDIIVSGSADCRVLVWDAMTRGRVSTSMLRHEGEVYAVALGRVAGRDVIVSGSTDCTARVWDAATGTLIRELIGHGDAVFSVAVGRVAGRDVIVSGSEDCTARVWDAATGTLISELTGHGDTVYGVALGRVAGRDVIVSGSADCTVGVWDAATGTLISELTGHRDKVWAVALGQVAGRDVIVSGSTDSSFFLREHRAQGHTPD